MKITRAFLPILCLAAFLLSFSIGSASADVPPTPVTVTITNTAGTPLAGVNIYDRATDAVLATTNGGGIANLSIQENCYPDWAYPQYYDTPPPSCGEPSLYDFFNAIRSDDLNDDDPCTSGPEKANSYLQWVSGLPFLAENQYTSYAVLPTIAGTPYQPALSNEELGLVGAINQERVNNGLTPVAISSVLTASADKYLSDLPARPLDPTADSTYCMASGPGLRAADAGFPTTDDINEDVVQNSPNAYTAMTSLENFSNSGALDGSITLIGVAQEGDRWVIDTSDLPANDPYYKRAGDTGNLGDYSLVSSEFPVATDDTTDDTVTDDNGDDTDQPGSSASSKNASLGFQKVVAQKQGLLIIFTLSKHARGTLRIVAVDKNNPKNRIVASYAKHPKHRTPLHARRLGNQVKVWGRLHQGKWLIQAHFVPTSGTPWKKQSVHRNIRVS